MERIPRLDKKIISVSSLDDIQEEKNYWLSKNAQERIEAIEPDIDQVVEKLVHLAARMYEDAFAGVTNQRVHPFQFREDELSPEPRPHL